jgi:YfiH family protein
MEDEILCDPVLLGSNVLHGFGVRGSQVPESTAFPRQVHGVEVAKAAVWRPGEAPSADAILSGPSASCVGIVTADCVPILVAAVDGSRVAAIHAGWRGLAAGVVEAGLTAFRAASGGLDWMAAVGPAARGCCYEVDEPVRQALSERYTSELVSPVLKRGREGHFMLDLPLLATQILERSGANSTRLGTAHRVCTVCNPQRFESYRRDGAAAGRLRHFIAARGLISERVDSPGGPP